MEEVRRYMQCRSPSKDYISYPIESCVPYKYLEYHNNAYQMFQVDSYTSTRNFVLRHLVWFEAPGCTAPENDWDTPDINETRSSESCYKNYTFYEVKYAARDRPVTAVSTQDNFEPQHVIWRKYADTCNAGPPRKATYSLSQCYEEEALQDSFKFETTGTHPRHPTVLVNATRRRRRETVSNSKLRELIQQKVTRWR
jgi:hypothetical protein